MILRKLKNPKFLFPLLIVFITCTFFYKFFFYKLIAVPTDITVGMYYPWLDQKWGGLHTDVPVANPLTSDIVSIIFQWRTMAIDSIKQGSFPFWNKQYFSGMPLFANFQNSIINPTNFTFFLTNHYGIAWTLMVMFQLIFSIFSAYYCFLTLKFKRLPSLIGAIVFSFSLFNIAWLEYGIHTYVASFLPLFIICLEKYKDKFRLKYLVILSVLIALQIYGGYPQYSIYSFVFISFYYLFFIKQKIYRKLLNLIIFIGLGLLLSAPLLIPGIELISRSIHNMDTTAYDKTQGFLPFSNILTLPSPNYFGNPATYDYQGIGFYDNNAIFPGCIAIIACLAVLSLFLSGKLQGKIKYLIITILISFLVSVQNPVSYFLKQNFGLIFSGNGISTRIFLLANFSFAWITAYFINSLDQIKKRNFLVIYAFPVWLIILLIQSYFDKETLSVSLKNTVYAFVLSLPVIVSVSVYYFSHKKLIKNTSLFLLLLFVVSELFYYDLKYLPFSKNEYLFPDTPSIKYLKENSGNYRISTTNTIPTNMWVNYGLSSPDGYDATLPLLNFEYFSLLQTNNFSPTAKRAYMLTNIDSPLYSNLSVKYVLRQKYSNFSTFPNRFTTVFDEKSTVIEENKSVLPKVRFIEEIIFLKDKYEFKETFSSIDFKKTAALYQNDQSDLKTTNQCTTSSQNINIVEDSANKLIFNTSNNCDRLVFISNSFFPGWQAFIDNQNTKIYQTNHMFQSVFVKAGDHHIELRYQPAHFKLAVYLAVSSVLSIFIILIYDRKKNKN
jgi:uncharacterized membrane protein YfhO